MSEFPFTVLGITDLGLYIVGDCGGNARVLRSLDRVARRVGLQDPIRVPASWMPYRLPVPPAEWPIFSQDAGSPLEMEDNIETVQPRDCWASGRALRVGWAPRSRKWVVWEEGRR